jgi:Ser/Thr protein kinase RdoA (MazF antagonist)
MIDTIVAPPSTAGVEGILGLPVPLNPNYIAPTASDIAEWIAATYEPAVAGSAEAQRRSYPSLYRIASSRGPCWLRVYSSTHPSLTRLEAQVEAVFVLHRCGANVVRPVAGRNRRFVETLNVGDGRRHAVLFTHAPGRTLDRSNLTEVGAFGSVVAQLHAAPGPVDDGRLAEIDLDYLADAPLRRLASHAAATTVLDEVRDLAREMCTRVGVGVPRGLCHGDVHAANANIDREENVTVFDFDELAYGPLAYDLACYWRKCILEHEQRHAAEVEWCAFLEGYETVRPITDDERRAIPALAVLRAIWTMAMPAQYVGIWGENWLSDPTYFDDHLTMIRRFAVEANAFQ